MNHAQTLLEKFVSLRSKGIVLTRYLVPFLFLLTWIGNEAFAQCGNISTLPCPEVVKTLPVNLDFNS
ncbi:MAG: hypothetical protein HC913_22630, partial [Microscillaceae bacterium]|nr:hypothetical protein [Microscillaceae bacterium]